MVKRNRIKEIREAIERYDNKQPLCDDGSDKEYAGNANYLIGWIKAIVRKEANSMTEREYYCGIDNWPLTKEIINKGAGNCYALPSKFGSCKTCGHLKEKGAVA